jgi:putative transposase
VDAMTFGRYQLVALIGQGGMGKVYKARDTVIGRDVAVKVLPPELASEPGYAKRFRRAAHTAARLTEPHIIPIHDTGEIDGRLYLGMRRLATVATAEGTVIETVPNPRPLETALRELRRVSRARSRSVKGSRLHRRVKDVRTHHLHVLTTRLAKTHGRIVVEGLDVAGMLRQKGLTGARARRRGLSDAALGTPRRQLSYKAGWYGSQLVVADRWFPSSKTCHTCGHVQDIGWTEQWRCDGCSLTQQRDDNAAINLARYEEPVSVVGPVGAAVKRGADRKTGPRPAGGREARKGTSQPAGEQPRDGVRIA